jgi:hypothetical protein
MSTTKTDSSVSFAAQATAAPAAQTPITATANSNNHTTKLGLQASYQSLITGLSTFYQPTDTFALQGGTLTRDAVIAELQKFIDAAEATKTTRTAWLASVQTERGVEAQVHPIRAAMRGIVAARFGADATQLVQFGFNPTKRTARTALTKAQAVVKSKATRTARGTKGAVQKKAVKGNVTGIVVTPTTAVTGVVVAPTTSAAPSAASTNGMTGTATGTAAAQHAA